MPPMGWQREPNAGMMPTGSLRRAVPDVGTWLRDRLVGRAADGGLRQGPRARLALRAAGRGSDRLGERNCVDSAFRSFPFRQANRFRMLSIRKHGEGPHRVVRAFIEGPHRMTHAFARGSPCVATGASPRGARTRPKGVFLSFPMPGGAAYGARDAAALHLVQYR